MSFVSGTPSIRNIYIERNIELIILQSNEIIKRVPRVKVKTKIDVNISLEAGICKVYAYKNNGKTLEVNPFIFQINHINEKILYGEYGKDIYELSVISDVFVKSDFSILNDDIFLLLYT